MQQSVCWDVLESQVSSYGDACLQELVQMLQSPEFDNNELFRAGRQFAKEYPSGIASLGASFPASTSSSADAQPATTSEIKGTAKARADAINFMRGIM